MDIKYILRDLIASFAHFNNWASLFLLNRLRANQCIETKDGLKLRYSNLNDIGIIFEMFVDRPYTREGFEIRKGDTVIDIGSNKGYFSLYASRTAGKVYSYEPAPANYYFLMQNIENNHATNIIPDSRAVSGKGGVLELSLNPENDGGHSIVKNTAIPLLVQVVTLEDIFKQNRIIRCHFLKMDCEGSEYDILMNTPPEILGRIDRISMEVHDTGNWKGYREMLERLVDNNFTYRVYEINELCRILHCERHLNLSGS